MDQGTWALELTGTFLSGVAWLCTLAATATSQWLTLSTSLLPTESYELGLWETCVVQELGATQCRPYNSLLGLPPDIRLARALMCTALGSGLLGLLLAVPGLRLVNSCEGPRARGAKRTARILGGVFCLAAGVVGLVPVSYMAHLTVLRFFDESVPDVVPRWEFGNALFCGWAAGLLHLLAGGLLVGSCLFCQEPPHTETIPLQTSMNSLADHSPGTKSEYV
ncbi:putative claudin-24 [Anguilla anguilla]|uniref:putative claudin-24 n=1 Tax=Anguilla anguilla TaxID=7936 RepID=UPI0015AE9A2F|nr:putative claudin-24 [Anguilla anguilla]